MDEYIELYTLEDEDGNQEDFEVLDILEHDGVTYYALAPHIELEQLLDDENQEDEMVILRLVTDYSGETSFDTIDNDAEFNKIADLFLKKFKIYYESEEDFDEN